MKTVNKSNESGELKMLEELNLETAKADFQKSKSAYIVELLEHEIHLAVSLTKAVAVRMPFDKCKKVLTAENWDDVLWGAIDILRRRGFTVDVALGKVTFYSFDNGSSESGGAVCTFVVSGWADALGEHTKLKP
jgi:hypothetical protein